jgi:hypothetical protein
MSDRVAVERKEFEDFLAEHQKLLLLWKMIGLCTGLFLFAVFVAWHH